MASQRTTTVDKTADTWDYLEDFSDDSIPSAHLKLWEDVQTLHNWVLANLSDSLIYQWCRELLPLLDDGSAEVKAWLNFLESHGNPSRIRKRHERLWEKIRANCERIFV